LACGTPKHLTRHGTAAACDYVVHVTTARTAGSGRSLFTVVVFSNKHAATRPRARASALAQTVRDIDLVDVFAEPIDLGAGSPVPPPSRYVAFLDAGDVWLPQRLELALAGLAQAPATCCRSRRADGLPTARSAGATGATSTPSTPTTASVIAIDPDELGSDAIDPRDAGQLRAVFADPTAWWEGLERRHEVTHIDEVGVLTGCR